MEVGREREREIREREREREREKQREKQREREGERESLIPEHQNECLDNTTFIMRIFESQIVQRKASKTDHPKMGGF